MEKIKMFFKALRAHKIFLSILVFFVVALLLIEGLNYYDKWKGEKRIDELAQELKRLDREYYERKAADKIGGKTPEETLDLFIQAVEKGDYELASKYFVVGKQGEELKSLQTSPKENIKNIINLLRKTTLVDSRKELEELYDIYGPGYGLNQTKEEFVKDMLKIYTGKATMKTKWDSYDFAVDFILYPSGNWKIEEI